MTTADEGIGEVALDTVGDGAAVDLALAPVARRPVHVRQIVFLPRAGERR